MIDQRACPPLLVLLQRSRFEIGQVVALALPEPRSQSDAAEPAKVLLPSNGSGVLAVDVACELETYWPPTP